MHRKHLSDGMEQLNSRKLSNRDSSRVINTSHPSTLLIGAYERENFGDLLFLHVSKKLLGETEEVTAGVPFQAHASSLAEHKMVQYSQELERAQYDRVWVAGGEVGGTTMHKAYRMSAFDDEYEKYSAASQKEQRETLGNTTGLPWYSSAYMPYLPSHSGSYVLNSVGLYSVGGLRGRSLLSAIRALRRADFVSVRENYSSRLLRVLGITHRKSPDVVHTIGGLDLVKQADDKSYFLLQVREETLASLGLDRLAQTIISIKSLGDKEIRLFRAGSARGHDSENLYQRVIERCNRLDPTRIVSISTATSSLEKCAEIAASAAWVGTSLHGNVVATAFGVPRVGLDNIKVNRYCDAWGEVMPFGVAMEDLDSAAQYAFNPTTIESSKFYAERLAGLARENFTVAERYSR